VDSPASSWGQIQVKLYFPCPSLEEELTIQRFISYWHVTKLLFLIYTSLMIRYCGKKLSSVKH